MESSTAYTGSERLVKIVRILWEAKDDPNPRLTIRVKDVFIKEVEITNPHKVGEYEISIGDRKYLVFGVRTDDSFVVSEFNYYKGDKFESFLRYDINSGRANSVLSELELLLGISYSEIAGA